MQSKHEGCEPEHGARARHGGGDRHTPRAKTRLTVHAGTIIRERYAQPNRWARDSDAGPYRLLKTIETMNSTVRLISHRSRGFRRLESLLAMIRLVCAKIPVALPT